MTTADEPVEYLVPVPEELRDLSPPTMADGSPLPPPMMLEVGDERTK